MTAVPYLALTSPYPDPRDNVFVLHGRTLRPGRLLAGTSRYGDDVWRLEAAILQRHQSNLILNFTTVSVRYRALAKQLCYCMLSGPIPPGERRYAVATIRGLMVDLVRFLAWLDRRGGPRLSSLGRDELEAYHHHVSTLLSSKSATTRAQARHAVRLFWRWREALPDDHLSFNPLHLELWGEAHHERRGENSTERIPEQVHGPLLIWALRFVDLFAPDILTADREWRQRSACHNGLPIQAGRKSRSRDLPQRMRALLDDHLANRRPLPGFNGKPHRSELATMLGCDRSAINSYEEMVAEVAAEVGVTDAVFYTRPAAMLDGHIWLDGIATSGSTGLAVLARHLHVSCYIVIAFLSGMRDSEIKHLCRGCLHIDRDSDGRAYRWKVNSLAFKGESDPTGVPATWVVGEAVARAIQTLEMLQMPDKDLLFSILPHGEGSKARLSTRALSGPATNMQLCKFIAWINDYCAQWGLGDRVPEVSGILWRLKTSQFRRTLAWFIARRPGGAIAGAIHYRHHSIQMFEGYAGTSDSGFRGEVESEQALARGERLIAMVDAHEHENLAGPAAEEATRRLFDLAERARFPGMVVLDDRRLLKIMKRNDPAVYTGKYVTCVHTHTKALCQRSGHEGLPDRGICQPLACRNVALTAENISTWNNEIVGIDRRLEARPPLPPLLADRLRGRRAEILAFLTRNTPETS